MEQTMSKNPNLRNDGSPKSTGFFGVVKTLDGTNRDMTEFSVGVDFGSGETEIPSLVPTLSREELDYLRKGNDPSKAIIEKAIAHAKYRTDQGKSPFWVEGEEMYSIPQGKNKNPRRTAASQQNERVLYPPVESLAQSLSEKAGAVLKGLANVPADAARYLLRGAVWAANKAGMLSEVKARMAKNAINESADNPIYLSKQYNDFLNAMGDKHPSTALASEVIGSALSGAAIAKGVQSLGKNLTGKVDLAKTPQRIMGVPIRVPKKYKHRWNQKGPVVIGNASAGAYTLAEEIVPTIDSYKK